MASNRSVLPIAAFTLLLAACGNDPEPAPVDDGGGAEGEVLGGSITDDMIPLDQLRSQSPPLREEASDDGPSATATITDAEPTPEPAEAPVDEPETDAAEQP